MPKAAASDSGKFPRLIRELPRVAATRLVEGMQKVTSTVMAHGAVVVTRHEQPSMVLMSVDRYVQLRQAAEPDLDGLARQFDELFGRMQGTEAAQRMAEAFEMSPAQLGEVAVRAAK